MYVAHNLSGNVKCCKTLTITFNVASFIFFWKSEQFYLGIFMEIESIYSIIFNQNRDIV